MTGKNGGESWAFVSADTVPAVTAALYEACGADPVMVIPRQQVPENGGPVYYGDFVIGMEGDRVAVGFRGTTEGSVMPFGAATVLAGYIAAYARLAQEEPDPAEVEELAAEMHRERENCSGAGEWDRQAARTALRWLNARKAAASAPKAADE